MGNYKVRFHGFENLTTIRNEYVISPEFTCFGHTWCLKLYPGGAVDSNDGKVGIFLQNMSNKSIKVQFGLSVRDKSRFVTENKGFEFAARGTEDVLHNEIHESWGWKDFYPRSSIIYCLVYGTLIVEVRMRNIGETTNVPFIPQNPISKTILSMFNDDESADIVFEVGNEKLDTTEHKSAKTTTAFHAHRNILQKCCSSALLGELCKSGGEAVSTVSITDVKPEVFKHMLYYVYGGKIAEKDMEENAKEIIHAADKYGIVGLKLEAEAAFVTTETMTFENAIDNLLYADATNCALIKEFVLDFIAQNRKEAVNKLSFDNVPGSAMKDLLAAVNRDDNKGGSTTDADDFSMMRVSTLRKMLDEKGLDIDGSREMMIATLKENM